MNPESFWFVCLFLSCTILQGLFGDSDRLASDIDTWHARMPLYNAFFSSFSWMVYYCYPTTPGGCFIIMRGFLFGFDERKQEYTNNFGDCGGGGGGATVAYDELLCMGYQ